MFFKVSFDNITFASSQNIPAAYFASSNLIIYVKFAPTELGFKSGNIIISSGSLIQKTVAIAGTGIPIIYNYLTFNNVIAVFGLGFNQSNTQTFTFHPNNSNIQKLCFIVKRQRHSRDINKR